MQRKHALFPLFSILYLEYIEMFVWSYVCSFEFHQKYERNLLASDLSKCSLIPNLVELAQWLYLYKIIFHDCFSQILCLRRIVYQPVSCPLFLLFGFHQLQLSERITKRSFFLYFFWWGKIYNICLNNAVNIEHINIFQIIEYDS